MNIFKNTLNIRYSFLIFCFLISVIFLLLILFLFDVLVGPKWSLVIPGLLTSFVIALFQALLSWFEITKIDEYRELKIIKILHDRKNPVYYGDLISKSKNQIKVLGVTAQRFLEDFAKNEKISPNNQKVLLRALEDGVTVKFLIADSNF